MDFPLQVAVLWLFIHCSGCSLSTDRRWPRKKRDSEAFYCAEPHTPQPRALTRTSAHVRHNFNPPPSNYNNTSTSQTSCQIPPQILLYLHFPNIKIPLLSFVLQLHSHTHSASPFFFYLFAWRIGPSAFIHPSASDSSLLPIDPSLHRRSSRTRHTAVT